MREFSSKKQPRRRKATKLPNGPEATLQSQVGGTRIAKLMARAGLCSRREAESWIAQGRVALNGIPLTDPAINISREDKVTIDGKPLAERARTRLFLFHKPRGLVTTSRDPQGRPTIFDYLHDHWPVGPRVVSIGRLDITSEGLLLLTNDGGLARVLELPATGWIRRYRVRANGNTSQAILDGLRTGVTVGGVTYAGIEATLDRAQGANCWLTMALREGKNREIKRVLETTGLTVNRLIRISYGPFQLGDLAAGAVEEVRTRVLRDQLGPSLAKAAGADFLSPLQVDNEAAEIAGIPSMRAHKAAVAQRPPVPRRRSHGEPEDAKTRARAKPAPRRRKHMSALRAEHEKGPKARTRIARGETADRAGRPVQVERLERVQQKRGPVLRPDKRQNKDPVQGDDSKKRHLDLMPARSGETKQDKRRPKRPPRRGREPAALENGPQPRAGGGQKPRRPRRRS